MSDEPPAPPIRIGKYDVIERLGEGGMAEVYLARVSGLAGFSKQVVIKRLRPELAQDERYVRLFVEEAKLAAQVQHKNVVDITELDSDADGHVFMAMEYVQGSDLNTLLVRAGKRKLRFPVWLSIHVACEVLEALDYAYALVDEQGRGRLVVHNDVSPENIFVARRGEVKLGDFGVAVDATRRAEPFPDRLHGKLSYMSPERLGGETPTHSSDLYAVGVVLWECLAQRRLFPPRKEPGVLERRVLKGVKRAPSHFVDDIPKRVDEIVMQALHKTPGARPESARAMQVALLDELRAMQARTGLDEVRVEVAKMLADQDASMPVPAIRAPSLPTQSDLASQPDFQRLLSDVLSGVSSRANLPVLPPFPESSVTENAFLDEPTERGSDQDVLEIPTEEHIPPPDIFEGIDDDPSIDDDDPETTAVVRTRRKAPAPPRRDPTPAAPPPAGPAPSVWIRSRGGIEIGPREPLEALGVLEELGSDDARQALELSVDRIEWLPVLRLPVLLGEAHIESSPTLPTGEQAGSFQTKSPTAVLAEVARTGASGRLVFIRYETTHAERTELQVEMGNLVGFGASRHLLPGWSGLLADKDTVAADVVHVLGRVIATRRELSVLAHAATQEHLADARALALVKALEDIHTWPWGRFAFEPGGRLQGGRVSPRPIFPLLPSVVKASKTVPVIMAHLSASLDVPMERAPSFDREARELQLGLEDQARLDRFGFNRSLRDSFASSTSLRDERPSVRLGYLLREIGLIRPAE